MKNLHQTWRNFAFSAGSGRQKSDARSQVHQVIEEPQWLDVVCSGHAKHGHIKSIFTQEDQALNLKSSKQTWPRFHHRRPSITKKLQLRQASATLDCHLFFFSQGKKPNKSGIIFPVSHVCVCMCVCMCVDEWVEGGRGMVTFAPASWIQRAHRMRPDCLHFSSNAILVRTNMKVSQLTIFLTSIALTTWWNITLKQSNSRPFISSDPFVALSLLKSSLPWIKTDQLYWFCVQQFVARHPSRLA